MRLGGDDALLAPGFHNLADQTLRIHVHARGVNKVDTVIKRGIKYRKDGFLVLAAHHGGERYTAKSPSGDFQIGSTKSDFTHSPTPLDVCGWFVCLWGNSSELKRMGQRFCSFFEIKKCQKDIY